MGKSGSEVTAKGKLYSLHTKNSREDLSLFGPQAHPWANHYVQKGSMNALSSRHIPSPVINKTDAMPGRSPEFHYWNQEGRTDG